MRVKFQLCQRRDRNRHRPKFFQERIGNTKDVNFAQAMVMLERSNDICYTWQWQCVGKGVHGDRQLRPDIQIFLNLISIRAKNM
jgi:hypothetical protein